MNMIEKVARAIAEADLNFKGSTNKWEQYPETAKQFWISMAKAAIVAMREPTEEMVQELMSSSLVRGEVEMLYTKAIDAALKE